MSFVGHDLFAVGCAMVTITLGVYREAARPSGKWIAWSIAAGTVATARAPLAILVLVLALLLFRKTSDFAKRFLAAAGVTVVMLHIVFIAWGHSLGLAYQPFHVFGRAGRAGLLVIPVGMTLAAGLAARGESLS